MRDFILRNLDQCEQSSGRCRALSEYYQLHDIGALLTPSHWWKLVSSDRILSSHWLDLVFEVHLEISISIDLKILTSFRYILIRGKTYHNSTSSLQYSTVQSNH